MCLICGANTHLTGNHETFMTEPRGSVSNTPNTEKVPGAGNDNPDTTNTPDLDNENSIFSQNVNSNHHDVNNGNLSDDDHFSLWEEEIRTPDTSQEAPNNHPSLTQVHASETHGNSTPHATTPPNSNNESLTSSNDAPANAQGNVENDEQETTTIPSVEDSNMNTMLKKASATSAKVAKSAWGIFALVLLKGLSFAGIAARKLFRYTYAHMARFVRRHKLISAFAMVALLLLILDGHFLATTVMGLIVPILAIAFFIYGVRRFAFNKR